MPRVSAIVPRRRGEWSGIACADGRTLLLPAGAVPLAVYAGAEISESLFAELAALSGYSLLLERALRILSRREHFERELRFKLQSPTPAQARQPELRARLADPRALQRVLDYCRERNYLDDGRAGNQLLEQALARPDIGPLKLRQLLRERGCPPQLEESLLARFASLRDVRASIRELLARRRGGFAAKLERLRARAERKAELATQAQAAAATASAQREDARRRAPARLALRPQLLGAVLAYLAQRGYSGDEALSEARRFADGLFGDDADGQQRT